LNDESDGEDAKNMTTTTTSMAELLRWGRGHRAGALWVAGLLLALGIAIGATVGHLGRKTGHGAGAPVEKERSSPIAAGAASDPAPAGTSAKPVTRVQISPERQQLIGVRTATVGATAPERTIRTVGILTYDETKVTEMHAKVSGWVEKVNVDYVGKAVRKGDPLLSVYSPDLVAAQLDYLIAIKSVGAKAGEAPSIGRRLDHSLTEASRTRLKLLDMTDAQIANLERTEQPSKTVTIYSPFSGVVIERKAFAGQYITPDMSTVKIADLSTIWAVGQVFEYELQNVKIGQTAEVLFPYEQTKPVTGEVSFIYPDIDPHTRTARVRIAFRNPGVKFKPESFVTIVLHAGGKSQLSVPREAVIDTGARQYVLMALADGYFEPRDVSVGETEGDSIPVFAGLSAGEKVVTSAQFLIDSETNLQAAMQSMSMTMPGMKTEGEAPTKDMKGMDMGTGGSAPVPPAENDMKGMPMNPKPAPETDRK
jgi:RND family efflux transporter MFP subunit